MKKLNELLTGLPEIFNGKIDWQKGEGNLDVKGVTSDSREVHQGDIFVAVPGASRDGHEFVKEAVARGAILVIGESDPQGYSSKNSSPQLFLDEVDGVPFLKTPVKSQFVLAALAAKFFDEPSLSLVVIGVTGTSGKTTTTYLIESILNAAGHRTGVIGTVNFRYGGKVFPATHTTPGPVELQRLFLSMKNEGCTAVVLEVSSHALVQGRVDSVAFDVMVFNNLSPEHLDFHADMEDYYQAKSILFKRLAHFSRSHGKSPVGVINREDAYGQRLISELTNPDTRDRPNEVKEFYVGSQLQVSLDGIEGEIDGIKIRSPLTGQFNCYNIAGAVATSQALRISFYDVSEGILKLKGVPGRLERVENTQGIHVWVDYAHKPDALEKVIQTLRSIRAGHRLITVFGCGGDRDRLKRPLMGRIALEGSDFVWVTSDNPRTEDPSSIIEEILAGNQKFGNFKNFFVNVDRRQAIQEALGFAQSGDLVLIAGKGHEDYQILGTTKIHFDDREVVRDHFAAMGPSLGA